MAFIAIEGIDGSGKATQTKMLVEEFERRGLECLTFDFPGYDRNTYGKLLAECLAGERGDFVHTDARIASTLYAADRFESSEEMRRALARDITVIADRFSGSNQIHQGGKIADEAERIAFLDWLDHVEHVVFKNPRPDVVIYLKAPVEVSLELLAQKRASKGGQLADGESDVHERDREYLDKCHAMANWLAARYSNWQVIDCVDSQGAIRSREDIHEDVLRAVARYSI
ncbi:MAG: thymidylate kinase [Patescibacteria group bacterium]